MQRPIKHPIDPKIDCVFKALLGAERNRRLLIHFLNAILADEFTAPIVEVEILNPYSVWLLELSKCAIATVETEQEWWHANPLSRTA